MDQDKSLTGVAQSTEALATLEGKVWKVTYKVTQRKEVDGVWYESSEATLAYSEDYKKALGIVYNSMQKIMEDCNYDLIGRSEE